MARRVVAHRSESARCIHQLRERTVIGLQRFIEMICLPVLAAAAKPKRGRKR
jgi:hypothetical protein